MHMMSDSIAAISTPLGEGGISVIRVSGMEAISTVDKLFRAQTKLSKAASHTVHYGHIVDGNDRVIEEVLVTIMKSPRSYTMEDVVEIGCHGGMVAVKQVLDLLLEQPHIRLAEPGEFTKRAFLNGRIDLSQAEAVIDLIRSKSDRAFSVALKQVEGTLSKRVANLREQLVGLMAHIEVNIDYPEHDVEEMTNRFIEEESQAVIDELNDLLRTAEQGKILREGIETVIVGRPNVGKSSLLNALARQNRAIVTDIPGTTRDVIEEYINVGGIPLKLSDTAGLRETEDVVEQIGVERSKAAFLAADLILIVFSASTPLSEDERELLNALNDRPTIAIINKVDLPMQIEKEELARWLPKDRIINMSLKQDLGVDQLEQVLTSIFFSGEMESHDLTYVSNARHIAELKKAKTNLQEAISATEMGIPIDMIQIDRKSVV